MDKFKHIMWYTFVYMPLIYFNGLSLIVLNDEKIIGGTFAVKPLKKTKREIDKEKFAKMMKRLCK